MPSWHAALQTQTPGATSHKSTTARKRHAIRFQEGDEPAGLPWFGNHGNILDQKVLACMCNEHRPTLQYEDP